MVQAYAMDALGFGDLPLAFFPLLAGMTVTYLALVQVLKGWVLQHL